MADAFHVIYSYDHLRRIPQLSEKWSFNQDAIKSYLGRLGLPLEVTLGILPDGCSYLLLTTEQVEKAGLRSPRPYRTDDFVSLSPVEFASLGELCEILARFKPKSGKHQKVLRGDTSSVNRNAKPDGGQKNAVLERARVLLRILTDPAFVSRQYNACSEWKKDVRFLSFAHTCKRYDTSRSLEERKSNPELLDYAWVEADPFTLAPKLDTAVHNRLAENIYLGQVASSPQIPTGKTRGYRETIKAEFGSVIMQRQAPTIILVQDEAMFRTLMKNSGIDTGLWHSGVDSLLRQTSYPRMPRSPPSHRDYRSRDPQSHPRNVYRRSRSRSPRRDSNDHIRPRSPTAERRPTERPSPPLPSQRQANVCIIDLKTLAEVRFITDQKVGTPSEIAQRLGLLPRTGESSSEQKVSAMNDALLIFEIFRGLVGGAPCILSQSSAIYNVEFVHTANSSTPATTALDFDDEADPNFQAAPVAPQAQVAARDGYDDEEDSDYGSDD